MTNNCLLKKFKSIVQNDNLPKYGEFKFHVNNSNTNVAGVYIQALGTINARIVGNLHFTDSTGAQDQGQTKTTTNGMTMYFSAGEGDVFVSGRYIIRYFGIDWDMRTNGGRIEMNIDEVLQSENDIQLSPGSVRNSIVLYGDLSNTDAVIIDFQYKYNNTLKGSLDKIAKNSHPERKSGTNGSLVFSDTILALDLSSVEGKKFSTIVCSDYVTGDIKYLADQLGTNINIPELAAPNITGSIEQFVARAQASPNSKTTGTVKFAYSSPKNFTGVTYGGTALYSNSNVPTPTGSQQVSFSWDAQGNITWSVA